MSEAKKRAKRRGNGEGSIFQRGDGRWLAKITTGYDANGKRLRRVVYGATKRAVQDELTKLQNQKLNGTLSDCQRVTVAVFLSRWLEDACKLSVRQTTYLSYKGIVDRHIIPRIGGVGLAKLTPLHVQGVYSAMARDGLSPRMQQMAHAVLHRALSRAVKWGMVPRNVCDAVERPVVRRKEMQTLTPEQAVAFLRAIDGDRLEALYVLAITTGLRQGELYGLKWDDIDLDDAMLSVRRTVVEVDGTFHINEPKTAKGKRRIELPGMAIEALYAHRKLMLTEGHAGSEWVFVDGSGGFLRRQNVQRRSFIPLLKKAELPIIRFHDLRHTAATLLLCEGVHPKVVQERLGHSQIGVTLDTYSHVLPSMQKEAAGKLDTLLKRPKPEIGYKVGS